MFTTLHRWPRAIRATDPLKRLRVPARLTLGLMVISGCAARAGVPADAPSSLPTASATLAALPGGTTRAVAPGVTHTYAIREQGPWAIHLVEVDVGVCGVELRTVKGADAMIGRETTSAIAARFGSPDGPVLAAVNADFFRYEPDGVPEGPQVVQGEVVAAAGTYGPSVSTRFGIPQPVFGTTTSGRAFVGEASLAGQIWGGNGSIPIGRVNAAPGPDSMAIFNRFAGGAVEAGAGSVRAVVRLIQPAPMAGDAASGVVTVVDTLVRSQVAPDAETHILAGIGTAATWLRGLTPGDTVHWHLAFAGAPGALDELVGGFPLLTLDGASVLHRVPRIWPPFAEGRHPRTAVGIRADGVVLLVVVDGRQPGYSEGMSLAELADLMLELGAVDALNLDGGGSTTLVISDTIVNRPSDAEERPVSNVLLVRRRGC